MTDLNALAAKVEGLSGPCRGTDAEIAIALGWSRQSPPSLKFYYWFNPKGERRDPERFTHSLDAALTLVPDACLAMTRQLWDGNNKAGHAVINSYTASGEEPDGKMWAGDFTAVAATAALALTAAALRARAKERADG